MLKLAKVWWSSCRICRDDSKFVYRSRLHVLLKVSPVDSFKLSSLIAFYRICLWNDITIWSMSSRAVIDHHYIQPGDVGAEYMGLTIKWWGMLAHAPYVNWQYLLTFLSIHGSSASIPQSSVAKTILELIITVMHKMTVKSSRHNRIVMKTL